jgi:hypothetical protein
MRCALAMIDIHSKGQPGRSDFINADIDVNTIVWYMSMTQKKAPVDTVDRLIESGDMPAIIARYVELTLQANKLKEYLMGNPDIAQALSALVPSGAIPVLRGRALSGWDSVPRSISAPPTVQLQQDNSIVPGAVEPLGTIHKDVPATFEYPMDPYTESAVQSQDAVKGMLQAYSGIDPSGEPAWPE